VASRLKFAVPRFSLDDLPLNLFIVARVVGVFLFLFSLTMFLPLAVSLIYNGEGELRLSRSSLGFGVSAAVCGLFGLGLYRLGRNKPGEFFRREGILCVALLWMLTALFGGLPFWFTGSVRSFWDGLFESTSGLTTTGSSIFGTLRNGDIAGLPPSILFWRSWLHWIGGIGIVVMFLIFLPVLGITEKTLFQAEVAGVSKEGLKPRIRASAASLLKIYLAITLFLFLSYLVFGMSMFDALCHAFATIATGGFSTRNYSLGEFENDPQAWGLGIEIIAIIGMFLAGTNFGLMHRAVIRLQKSGRNGWARIKALPKECLGVFARDTEFRFYFVVFCVTIGLLTFMLWSGGDFVPDGHHIARDHDYSSVTTCLRDASFQTASLISSTGFANSNLLTWPMLCQCLLLAVMIGGACGGSTGGGLKMARVLIVFKLLGRNLRRFLRPRSVEPMRFGNESVDPEIVDRVVALFVSWVSILLFGTLLVIAFEPRIDALSGFTAVVTALCNMGPGFTQLVEVDGALATANPMGINVGSYGSFGELSSPVKALMSFIMILGRLEVFTPLVIFLPSFWRH